MLLGMSFYFYRFSDSMINTDKLAWAKRKIALIFLLLLVDK